MSARWLCGVDVGQSHDPSAAIVIDRQRGQLDIRVAQRFPLGESYDAQLHRLQGIIDRLGSHYGEPNLDGGVQVAIDATGLGGPVVEMATRKLRPSPIGVTITAGSNATTRYGRWTAPKQDLVGSLSVELQNHTLHAAPALADLATLTDELKGYSYDTTATGTTCSNDARTQHDDMVVALMLSVYLHVKLGPYHAPGSPEHAAQHSGGVHEYRDDPSPGLHTGVFGNRVIGPPGHPEGFKVVVGPDMVPRKVRKSWPFDPDSGGVY